MNLKELREERGFSQKELATKLGVSPTNIYNYEVGRTEPSIDMLILLAKTLEVSVDYLIGNSEDFTSTLPTPGAQTLLEEEKELLSLYRTLSAEDKRGVMRIARSLTGETKVAKSLKAN